MDIKRLGNELPNIFADSPAEGAQQAQQSTGVQQAGDMIEGGGEMIGQTQQALGGGSSDPVHHLPHAETMPYMDQGSENACGTTSLAMIMSYLGVPMTHEDIDNAIRRMDIFTAPNDIIEFARDHGLEAEGYNHGTFDELKSHIDAGHPVECLIQSDTSLGGSANGPHYVAVTGYETDPATGQEYVLYHDPNWGDDPSTAAMEGSEVRIPREDFEKMWGNTNMPPGAEKLFIAFAPGGTDLPPSRLDGMEGMLGAADGISNLTNGLNRLYSPDSFGSWLHGVPQFFGGIVQTVGCGIGGGIQWLGQNLNEAVEGIPVLENFVQPFGDIVDGVGAVIGDVFNGIGEACDDVGGAFESLFDGDVGGFFEGMGEAVGDVVGGVVDAVGDAVEAVGDAISDFFSGW